MAKAKKSIKSRFKFLTALASIFGSLSLISLVTILVLAESNVIDLFSDGVRSYKAEFYDDGVFLEEQILERGAKIVAPEPPKVEIKELDGSISVFLGWDITGEGIPDTIPTQAYFNFTANTVYFTIPGDAIPYDMLMEMFENGLIDLEKFFPEGGFDQDMLEDLIKNSPSAFKFQSDYSCAGYDNPMHFRVSSYGDYDPSKTKWKNAPTYPSSRISSGSLNPLEYAGDKCKNAAKLIGTQGTFDTTIKMPKKGGKYPVFGYEIGNTQNLDSDSYSYTNIPSDLTYTVTSNEFFTTAQTIDVAKSVPFSNTTIASDEKEYREYAKSNYTKVDSKYNDALSRIITDGGFKEFNFNNPDSNEIIDIETYLLTHYEFTMTKPKVPGGKDAMNHFLMEGKKGMGFEFASAATLLYRKLGLPARFVEGYCAVNMPDETGWVDVKTLQSNFWVEVYVANVGWVTIDPAMGAMAVASGLIPEGMLGEKGFGSSLDSKNFDVNPNISSQGPGDSEGDDLPVFTYETDYSGAAYFKMTTYDSIDGSYTTHSSALDLIPYSLSGITTSPTLYTSFAADGVLPINNYKITYEGNLKPNAPWPLYGNRDNRGTTITDQYQANPCKQGDEVRVSSAPFFEPSYKTLNSLKYNLSTNYPTIYQETQAYGTLVARNFYLSMKPEYQTYFTQFAEENHIVASDREVYTKVRDLIKNHASYNINFAPYPAGEDPILYFMQVAREGICNNYAAATVMMFRALGIPSRLAVGYMGVAKKNEKNVMKFGRRHAWTEVWIDGIGWVDIDSTGSSSLSKPGDSDGFEIYGAGGGGGGGEWPSPTISLSIIYSGDSAQIEGNALHITKTYDGKPIRMNLTPEDGLLDGHTLSVSTPSWSKFGEYGGYITIKVLDSEGQNVTDAYDNITISGSFGSIITGGSEEVNIRIRGTVDKANLFIITGSYSWNYIDTRGDTMIYETYECQGLAQGDHIARLVFTGSVTAIGTESNSVDKNSLVIMNEQQEDVTDCYIPDFAFGEISINL